jgi:hypothetical protein
MCMQSATPSISIETAMSAFPEVRLIAAALLPNGKLSLRGGVARRDCTANHRPESVA